MTRGKAEGGKGEGGKGEGERRKPRKRFGQHFLERAWVTKVISAIAPTSDQTFLEIGPGRGALTRPLAERAGRVVAIEIDRDLAGMLERESIPNLRVVPSITC